MRESRETGANFYLPEQQLQQIAGDRVVRHATRIVGLGPRHFAARDLEQRISRMPLRVAVVIEVVS